MPGLDALQVLEVAVRPALREMGPMYSTVAAEQLVMGTAAVESGLRYLKQHGHGPAIGLWQMEPDTFHDLVDRAGLHTAHALSRLSLCGQLDPLECAWNLRFAAALCRVKYLDDPHPLPEPGDVQGLAITWKRCYNSYLGAGTFDGFRRAWGDLIAPRYEEMWPQ